MSTLELKQKLFKQIELTDNDEVLEQICRILKLGSFRQEINPINIKLKASIDEGHEDYRQGRFVTNEVAKREFRKIGKRLK